MNAELVFRIANLVAVAGWFLLAGSLFISGPRVFRILVYGTFVSLALSAAYLAALVIGMQDGGGGGFGSLAAVQELFANPTLLLAGWIHYLAFDLFVGTWMAANSRRTNVPRLLVIPCLFFTFMFGPVGFLSYVILRSLLRREVDSMEAV